MDDPQVGPEARRGQLQGNRLRVLAVVAAAAIIVAVWQFSALSGDDDDPFWVGSFEEETTQLSIPGSGGTEAGSADIGTATPAPSPESSAAEPEPTTEPAESDRAADTSEPDDPGEPGEDPDDPDPEPEDPEESEDAEPGMSCTASIEETDSWPGAIEVKIKVVNTGDQEFDSWEVVIDIHNADVSHYWWMDHVRGDRYMNEHWNGRLDPGDGTLAFFQAQVDGHVDLPATVPCTPFD